MKLWWFEYITNEPKELQPGQAEMASTVLYWDEPEEIIVATPEIIDPIDLTSLRKDFRRIAFRYKLCPLDMPKGVARGISGHLHRWEIPMIGDTPMEVRARMKEILGIMD